MRNTNEKYDEIMNFFNSLILSVNHGSSYQTSYPSIKKYFEKIKDKFPDLDFDYKIPKLRKKRIKINIFLKIIDKGKYDELMRFIEKLDDEFKDEFGDLPLPREVVPSVSKDIIIKFSIF